MMKDPENRKSLQAINSAYYIVALGREEPKVCQCVSNASTCIHYHLGSQ